jgi:hypothetical protein
VNVRLDGGKFAADTDKWARRSGGCYYNWAYPIYRLYFHWERAAQLSPVKISPLLQLLAAVSGGGFLQAQRPAVLMARLAEP